MSAENEWNAVGSTPAADDGSNELSLMRFAIGTFDGLPGHGRFATEWLQNFNSITEFHEWSPDLKLKSVGRYLVGRALEWHSNEINVLVSWPLFELAFKRTFATGSDDIHNYIRMKERVQRNDETVIMYFNDKVSLCESVGLNFARVKEEILFGMSSRQLAYSLLIGEHANTTDMLRDVIEFESINLSPSPASTDQSVTAADAALQTPVTESPKPRDLMSVSNASGDFTPLVYNNDDVSFEKIAKINKLFFVPCVIDSDTGECLLQEAVARRFKITWCTAHTITVYKRKTQMIIKALGSARVSVAIDEVLLDDFQIFIVPNDVCSTEFIVGRTWCESSQIVYDKYEHGIRFYNISDFPFANMDVAALSPNRLVTSSVANLAPNEVTYVGALAGKTTFEVAVFNGTAKFVTLQAEHLLARRVEIIPVTETHYFPFPRDIGHDDIQLPKEFDIEERRELLKLLNKHHQCFVQSLNDLSHTIAKETDKCSQPVAESTFSAWCSKNRESSSNKTCHLLDTNPSHALPVLRVHKKEDETRVMVHYHNNSSVRTLTYPLSSVENYLNRISSFTLFTRLDIVHEHLDIPMQAKKDIAHIATCLNNAPFTLTTMENWSSLNVKKGIPINCVDHYFVLASHWKDMLLQLDVVLTMLRKANFTIKLSKCVFASRSIEFLGYEVVANSIRPSQKKILEIVEYKTPETIRDVRRFIGLARFFQKFVPRFLEIIRPITDLTRKPVTFVWTDKQQNAFESLKQHLTTSVPVLKIYNSKHYTELHIEATVNMFLAMLFQIDENGKKNLVHCISKVTSDIERKYHISKLTLKAIIWGLNQHRFWFQNTTIPVVTDCQSLIYMNAMKTIDLECFQYFEALIQKYNFEIIHKAGTPIEYIKKNISFIMTDVRKTNYMQEMQHSDPELLQIINELMSNHPRRHLNKYELRKGLLYCWVHTTNGIRRLLVMVPKVMRKSIIIHYHDLQEHLTLDKTLEMLQETYYFPKVRRYARLHIKYCSVCTSQSLPQDQRQNIQLGNCPFDTIHIKHSGPFPKSEQGNQYAFVIVDNITMYTYIHLTPSCTTKDAIRALECFTKRFKLPKQIVSDQSYMYKSLQFCTFLETNNIQHCEMSTRKLQVNPEVERINDVILAVIYTYINNKYDWDQELDILEIFLNTTEIPDLKTSPFKAVLNLSSVYKCTIFDILRVQEPHYNLPREVREELSLRVDFGQMKLKAWNKPYFATKKLYPGTIVFLQDPAEKSLIKYLGPMVVIKQCTEFIYEIVQFGFSQDQCSYVFDAHISSLKIYEGKIIISSRYDTENNIAGHTEAENQMKTSTTEDSTPRKFWLLPIDPVTL